MAIPPTVVSGETITIAWGNAVRDWAASGEVNGSTTFTYTTTASIATAGTFNMTIPANWLGWEATCHAFWTTTSASATSFEVQWQIDGTNQSLVTPVNTLASGNVLTNSLLARRTGMVTTGSRSFLLRARHLASTSVGFGFGLLVARAVRTS